MRKSFTRFFSLMLLLLTCCFPFMGYAVCDLTIAAGNVKLVTDVVKVCDGDFLDYKVEGFDPALYEFAFNYNPLFDPSGQFTASPLFTTKESSTFTVNVKDKLTGCISNKVTITAPDVAALVTTAPGVQDALCHGGQGEITINWTGGVGALEYYVVPSANFTLPIANLASYKKSTWLVGVPAGTYYLAVQNATLCADLDVAGTWKSVTITEPGAITIQAPATPIVNNNCFGGRDGIYTVNTAILGGVAPFTASIGGDWIDLATTNEFRDLAKGSYTVTVKDFNGCPATRAFVITEPAEIKFDIAIVDVACNGAMNGQITVSNVTGGTGSYSYSLDGIDFTNTTGVFSGLAPTYYSLWVKDGIGCPMAYENPNNSLNVIAVQSPADITFFPIATNPDCIGGTGSISITAKIGGVVSTSVQYSFDGGATWVATSSKAVAPGTYQIMVSNSVGGCPVGPIAVTVTDKTAVTATFAGIKSPTCPGGSDGRFVVNATGGNGGYSYSVDGSEFYANNIIFEKEGVHTVVVKDAKECLSASLSVTVPAIAINEIVLAGQTNITCFGKNTGRIDVNVVTWANGRTPKVWYAKNEADVYTNGTVLTDATPLTVGDYYVGATDGYGCFFDVAKDGTPDVIYVKITEVPKLEITNALATQDASCFGDPDGIITITATGGTAFGSGAHAQYWLSTSNIDVSLTNAADFADFAAYDALTGISTTTVQALKGTYYVYVRDNGCVLTKWATSIVVNGFDAVNIVDPLAAAITHNDCNGSLFGAIVVAPATGGSGSLVYTLQKSVAGVFTNVTGNIDVTSSTFTGLAAGTYKVVVKDQGGCKGDETASIVVTQPDAPVTFTVTGTDITCNGANNGIAKITVAGGTPATGVKYWFKIAEQPWQEMTSPKNVVITAPGTYSIQVKDSKDCTPAAKTVTIAEPTAVVATLTKTNVTNACNLLGDGTIKVVVTGGTKAGEYQVSKDGTTWVSTVGGVYTFTLLDAGAYTISAKDDNSCVRTAQTTISQPVSIAFSAAVTTNVLCNGGNDGAISVTGIAGGTAPYKVTVNGVTKDAVAGAASFTGLIAGTYTAVVKDVNLCSFTINNLKVTEPAALTLLATKLNDIGCTVPGKFSLAVTGGSESYVYYWAKSDVATGHVLLADIPAAGTVWSSNSVAEVTEAGTYIVWAKNKDANMCQIPIGGEVDDSGTPVNEWRVKIEKPTAPVVFTATVTGAPACNGDKNAKITVTAISGGMPVAGNVYTVTVDGVVAAGGVVTGLGAGKYAVVVTDKFGCSAAKEVEITEPVLLTATLRVADGSFTCSDAIQGYIEVTAAGGTEPYSYELLRDDQIFVNYQANNSFLVQINHRYVVNVKDAHGCPVTSNPITIAPVLPVKVDLLETTCWDDLKASVIVKASGEAGRKFQVRYRLNTEAFTAWSPLFASEYPIDNLVFANDIVTENFYTFEVKDDKDCNKTIDHSFVRTQHPLEATLVQSDDKLSTTLLISGGISPYFYQVGNGEIGTSDSGNGIDELKLSVGTNSITINDSHSINDPESRCKLVKSLVVAPLEVTAVPESGNSMTNNFDVVLTFNRAVTVAAGDITGGTFTPGTGIEFTVAMTGEDLTTVKLELGADIADAVGNKLAATTFTYKIGDHVFPIIDVVTDPVVPTPTVFTVGLKFNKPVTGVIASSFHVDGGTLTDVSGSIDTYTITVSGNEGDKVTIDILDAIKDMSANANKFAGQTLTYTIGDFTAPELVSKTPVDITLADNVPTFKMTFDEDVAVGAGGMLKVYKVATTTPVLSIPITAAMVNGKVVTVTYAYNATTGGLDRNARYYVLVEGSALTDVAGNKFEGVSDAAAWGFKTGPVFATGIDQVKASKFEVYPNPFVSYVDVVSSAKLSKVVVTNIAGQVVKEVVNPARRIQLNELRSGIYFISLYDMDNVIAKTAKIVKR